MFHQTMTFSDVQSSIQIEFFLIDRMDFHQGKTESINYLKKTVYLGMNRFFSPT